VRFERWKCVVGLALTVALAIELAGCEPKSATPAVTTEALAKPAPQAKTKADPETVGVEPGMLANIKIETVKEQALPRLLTATGKVQFNEDQTARILAPLPGQVLEFNLRVGDAVKKDQVLFSIKSREVAALVSDYQQTQRDQDLAEKTYNMTKDLYEHQAASRVSFQQAEADLTKARSQVGRSEESLRVLGLDPKQVLESSGLRTLVPVRCPISGSVIERTVTLGQFVQADATALLTVADLSSVWVMVDIFERDLHLIHPGQRVQVTAAAYPDRAFTAHVDRINDRVDPETRTIKVRLLVANTGMLLKPEMFITASLVLNESTRVVTVPAAALVSEGDRSYAFVETADRRFGRRAVLASPDGPGRVRVSSGIQTGDRVVIDGALLLRFRQKQEQEPE
jgi:cobalt-zinc-cadmium efflux system membrane fusion protein